MTRRRWLLGVAVVCGVTVACSRSETPSSPTPDSTVPLFDSNAPGATVPLALSDLSHALLPGETLVIGKASATLTLGDLTPTYDGSPKSATVTTGPAGLSGVSVTYGGSAAAPTGAGSYAVVAALSNAKQ